MNQLSVVPPRDLPRVPRVSEVGIDLGGVEVPVVGVPAGPPVAVIDAPGAATR